MSEYYDAITAWGTVGLGFVTLILAFVALFQEGIRRWWYAPKLKVEFELEPPFCQKIQPPRGGGRSGYYFRFSVLNRGRSKARSCEAVLEEMWHADISGAFYKRGIFFPVSLRWCIFETDFCDINPHRRQYCNIGYIVENRPLAPETFTMIPPDDFRENQLPFFLNLVHIPYSQPNVLAPGCHKIRVTVYCENAEEETQMFKITWSGNWRDTEQEMFREIVIELV